MVQKSSLVEPCITTVTSAISLMATLAAQTAFMEASLLGRSELLWDPTMTTGTGVLSDAPHALPDVLQQLLRRLAAAKL